CDLRPFRSICIDVPVVKNRHITLHQPDSRLQLNLPAWEEFHSYIQCLHPLEPLRLIHFPGWRSSISGANVTRVAVDVIPILPIVHVDVELWRGLKSKSLVDHMAVLGRTTLIVERHRIRCYSRSRGARARKAGE